jgi:uncharacterized protein (TIGR02453 family)
VAEQDTFTGFTKETMEFYRELTQNNDTGWFLQHKEQYGRAVLEPARAFILAMGDRLSAISPNIQADTRTSGAGSLFRIYRDIRFSRDKRPYKTYLGIYFWEGSGKKLENPGFYFHLDPAQSVLMLGAGIYIFPRPALEIFRKAVVDTKKGPALTRAVRQVSARGTYLLGGKHFKRIPSGFDGGHPNSEFLLYNGLWASYESSLPDALYSQDLIDFCFEKFMDMDPIQRWVVQVLESF